MIRLVIAAVVAVVASPTLAQNAACQRNEFEVFEEVACAAEADRQADRELNATYKELLSLLRPDEADALRTAQRAWLAFVAADARFTLAREGDGSAGWLVILNDRERLARERIDALRFWLPQQ